METGLQWAKEQIESPERVRFDFLAKLSHELRDPLSAIIGMTTLLISTDLTQKQQEYVQVIRSSSDILLTLVNDILDFSRIESGKLRLDPRPFNLCQCIEETLRFFHPRAGEKGLTLRYEIAEQTPLHLIGDVTRIRQILMNLVSNSVKFTERGEVVVVAQVAQEHALPVTAPSATDASPIALHLYVRDTGIGIPRNSHDQLFQLFSQVHTNHHYGGVGLGLAICKQLVTLMNGRIWVESEEGKGATFHVIIELALDRSHQYPTVSQAPSPPRIHLDEQMGQRHPLRILVADDTLFVQKFALELLARLGYRADIATNGEEVLQALRRAPYDVILLDVHMPGMDGFEVTQHVRSEWPKEQQPRIIAVTAQSFGDEPQRYLEAGMDDVLSKPILVEELMEKLEGVSPLPDRTGHTYQPQGHLLQTDGIGSVIDEAVYHQFANSLGSENHGVLRDLIDAYLTSASQHIQAAQLLLRDAKAQCSPQLLQFAHTLGGNSAQIGAVSLANLCRELGMVSRTGNMEQATVLVQRIASELEHVRNALERMRG